MAKEIVLWHEFDGPGDTSINTLEEICKLYSERNGITVRTEVMSLHGLVDRIMDIKKTGKAAQVCMVPSNMVELQHEGNFSKVPASVYDDLVPENLQKTMFIEGAQYGVPVIGGNHLLLYYNKDILPDGISGWSEIEKLTSTLRSKGKIPISTDINQSFWLLPILSAFGGWPIKGEDIMGLDVNAVKKSFDFLDAMMKKNTLESYNASYEMMDKFFAGEIGAIINGEWVYSYINAHMKDKLGICGLPLVEGIKPVTTASAVGLIFPNHSLESEYSEHLKKFARFMLSEECQKKWANDAKRVPISTKVMKQVEKNSSVNRKAVIEQIKSSYTLLNDKKNALTWFVLEYGIDLYFNKGIKSEEIIEKLKKRIQEAIKYDKQLKSGK